MLIRRLTSAATAIWAYGLAAAVILVAIAVVVWLGLPPRVVVMTTGAPGSDYEALGVRYRAVLQRAGLQLRLLPSAGAVENLQRLSDAKSGVMVGFAQGGLTNEAQSPNLTSLGTLFFEPLWFFTRVPPGSIRLEGLRGKKIAIGQPGSGTRVLSGRIMALNGIAPSFAEFQSLSTLQAGEALVHGDIDAALMIASWESPVVHRLLASADVTLLSFPRADAYVALNPYLTVLRLPAGVGDLAMNRPPSDVDVIAPKASLIVRRDLHPAIQYLLLEAAAEIHSAPNIFQKFGQFPAIERGDFPLSEHAQQFHKTGTPLLQRYLPFWLAVFVSRLLLVLIPAAALAYPVLNVLPSLTSWNVKRRILQLYGELRLIEADLEQSGGVTTSGMLARLQRWEQRAHRLRVPVELVPVLYSLRTHIALLRDRTASAQVAASAAERVSTPSHAVTRA